MVKSNIMIEDARIGFRNFSGKEGQYNPAGLRNFCVFLEPELAETLKEDGWNVKWLKPKDENEEPQAYLKVTVRYDNDSAKSRRNPNIVLISHKGRTKLNEETVGLLDWAEIGKVDLIINPSNWEVNGNKGVKAYIKSLFVTIVEDELEMKYYDTPDSAADTIGGCGHCDTCDGHCNCHEH
jgi:hypothetical protein